MREGLDLRQWIAKVQASKPAMDALVAKLETCGATAKSDRETHDVAALHYLVKFSFPGAVVVTMGIILMDYQSDSDLVIETITTLPATGRGRGFGSGAVANLLQWARDNGLTKVRATQVSGSESEAFWLRNGFARCSPPNPCNDFIRTVG